MWGAIWTRPQFEAGKEERESLPDNAPELLMVVLNAWKIWKTSILLMEEILGFTTWYGESLYFGRLHGISLWSHRARQWFFGGNSRKPSISRSPAELEPEEPSGFGWSPLILRNTNSIKFMQPCRCWETVFFFKRWHLGPAGRFGLGVVAMRLVGKIWESSKRQTGAIDVSNFPQKNGILEVSWSEYRGNMCEQSTRRIIGHRVTFTLYSWGSEVTTLQTANFQLSWCLGCIYWPCFGQSTVNVIQTWLATNSTCLSALLRSCPVRTAAYPLKCV